MNRLESALELIKLFTDKSISIFFHTVYNMHSVTSNAVAVRGSYSETEIDTGTKWIDGKKIYRKSLQAFNTTVGNGADVAFSSFLANANIDSLIKLQGTVHFLANNVIVPIPSTYVFLFYKTTDGIVYIRNIYSSNGSATVRLFAEYTKTT